MTARPSADNRASAFPARSPGQPSGIASFIRDDVHRPALDRPDRGDLALTTRRGDVSARSRVTQAQALVPVQPLGPLMIHLQTLSARQEVAPEVAVAYRHLGEIVGTYPQLRPHASPS